MDIHEFKQSTFEEAKDHVLSKGLKSLKKDDDDFFSKILMSGCRDLEDKVSLLVSSGVDVNAQTPEDFTALSRIIKKGKNPHYLIDLLLANGADLEAPSALGLTPLHCAIILQNVELVKYLISKGANPNAVDDEASSCLMLALSSNDEYKNKRYYWPFYDVPGSTKKAVNFEILDELVLSGAKLDYQSGWDTSIADLAIGTGKIQVVDWLVKHGIKPTDTVSPTSSKTLLMSASEWRRGSIPILNHLLGLGATVDAVDQDGQTALFYARDDKIAKALLDAGANLIHLDNNGRSIFQRRYLNAEIFQKYGKEFVGSGGDINGKDTDGRGILHHLVDSYDNLKAIKLAISLGCEVNATDQNGITPLMLARSEYWNELVAAGARINDVDANGDHALNRHLSYALLEFGAEINWSNKRGQTPLMLAARKGDLILVRALLEGGASNDVIDRDGMLATDYADASALAVLVEFGASINPASATALVTAITGKNVSLSLKLLENGLAAHLSDAQVKSQLAVLENIAQKNLDLFKNGIFGADEKAAKLIAKVVAAREHILEAAKAHPVCADEELPQMLRPGEWPCKLEAPTPHITVSTPLDNGETPSFKPPEGFHQRMSALHDQIKLDLSDWRASEKSKHIKSQERDVLKICKKHRSTNGGLSYYDKYDNKFGIDELLICSDDVLFEFWNTCFEIYGDLLISYDINIIEKSKYDLMLYRLQGKAFEGIKQGHDFATHCLTYFDAIEIAPVMARVLGNMPAQTWLRRFSDTAISGLLVGAFSDVLNDRSIAQQTLRWLARQGFRDKIELKAKSYGEEAHAFAMKFLDRSSDADFLPKKLPKLPAYFVASAHPAPVLKSSGKSLPPHAVDTFARMLLASTCYLPTPALLNVIKVCDAQSLADFAISAYDGWVKNGSKKDGIGFLHALGYIGDARAAPLIIKAYKNEPFYPATAAAIEVLGAIGSNTSISGLLSIMRFSRYDKAQAYAQEVLESVADARGLTTEQLEDLAIPDLGLNSGGEMHLNFGARQFTASITAELDVVLTDGSGRVIKALPKATNEDDARLAKLATVQWKEFNSARKGVSKGQLQRFEQAMAQTRRWDIGTFKDVIAVHPLLVKMVRNLVWAEASDDLKQINPFRIDATGRFVDVNDEVLRLPDNASIILPHPLLLNIAIPLWQDVFVREKLTQPVLQLARKWFVQGTQTDDLIDEKSENQVPLGALKGLKSKGWEFDEIGAGMVWRVSKSVDGAWASMDVDPGWSLSGHDGDGSTGSQTVKLSMSGSNPIAYSELVREFLSLPVA